VALLEIEKVEKTYVNGKVRTPALRNVTLAVEKGELTALVGPSGSGKTTLINLIGGLDRADCGVIVLGGRKLTVLSQRDLADIRLRRIGFVFQAYNLIPVLTALENVEYVMLLQGVPPRERMEKSMAVLREVGLADMARKRPNEMSGGQQQRVAVARAVVSEPDLVLADEPTANLDSATAGSLLDMMKEMNERKGVTFIFSTHDPLVMDRARRVVQLRDGAVVQ
jgi:putative ABC transport system ATP-binding protein